MRRLSWILKIMLILQTQSVIFNTVVPIKTSFSCFNKTIGFYADTAAHCKIYHMCNEFGNKFTYHCPEGTAFSQDTLICDHAHLVYCQGNASYSTYKQIDEGKHNNFPYVTSSANRSYTLFESSDGSQLQRHGKIQYGLTFNPQEYFKNFSNMETTENKRINSFYTLNATNNITNASISHITNTRTQNVHTINLHKSELRKGGNISIKTDSFYSWDKVHEKQNLGQKEYIDHTVNVGLYTFLKFSSNMFPESIQNPVNNVEKNQSMKTSNDAMKLPFVSYSDYPYLEALKPRQKNVTILFSSTRGNTALTTTDLPLHALSLPLTPLIPSELEYDPYYPKFSTSTESFYTSTYNITEFSYNEPSIQATWSTITHFELPPILPDLYSLEDIVDRRKLFYIPRIKIN